MAEKVNVKQPRIAADGEPDIHEDHLMGSIVVATTDGHVVRVPADAMGNRYAIRLFAHNIIAKFQDTMNALGDANLLRNFKPKDWSEVATTVKVLAETANMGYEPIPDMKLKNGENNMLGLNGVLSRLRTQIVKTNGGTVTINQEEVKAAFEHDIQRYTERASASMVDAEAGIIVTEKAFASIDAQVKEQVAARLQKAEAFRAHEQAQNPV